MAKLAAIEYHGSECTTQSCLNAIARLYQPAVSIERVELLTANSRHAFLVYFESPRIVAIKCGFTSGYNGEGPRGLATALRFFDRLDVPISEIAVADAFLDRVNNSSLIEADLEKVAKYHANLGPSWREYMDFCDPGEGLRELEFQNQFSYEVPLRVVDRRILDLALELPVNPDSVLMSAYRRLENIVRERCGLDAEHGAVLFAKAFQRADAPLHWPEVGGSENEGRAALFSSVYKAFRNPRAHHELSNHPGDCLREFLLINELFRLEASAKMQPENNGA